MSGVEPDGDWIVDGGLTSMRHRIYALLPGHWTFYGPIRLADGSGWEVGVATTVGPPGSIAHIAVRDRNLPTAFRRLAEDIVSEGLAPTRPD